MKLTNLSIELIVRLGFWVRLDSKAEGIVFLPDACPRKSPLAAGTASLTHQADWRRVAISDCGRGTSERHTSRNPNRPGRGNCDTAFEISVPSRSRTIVSIGGMCTDDAVWRNRRQLRFANAPVWTARQPTARRRRSNGQE